MCDNKHRVIHSASYATVVQFYNKKGGLILFYGTYCRFLNVRKCEKCDAAKCFVKVSKVDAHVQSGGQMKDGYGWDEFDESSSGLNE